MKSDQYLTTQQWSDARIASHRIHSPKSERVKHRTDTHMKRSAVLQHRYSLDDRDKTFALLRIDRLINLSVDYRTLTSLQRIQPWSNDRRNKGKQNRTTRAQEEKGIIKKRDKPKHKAQEECIGRKKKGKRMERSGKEKSREKINIKEKEEKDKGGKKFQRNNARNKIRWTTNIPARTYNLKVEPTTRVNPYSARRPSVVIFYFQRGSE